MDRRPLSREKRDIPVVQRNARERERRDAYDFDRTNDLDLVNYALHSGIRPAGAARDRAPCCTRTRTRIHVRTYARAHRSR